MRDIGNFSELMTELDTLVVYSNFCICAGEDYQTDIITKNNDSVFIQVLIDDGIKGKMNYEKRLYLYSKSDTLNFETIYSKLQKRNILNHHANLRFEIVHNRKDTLKLFTYGLMDFLKISNYLYEIKDQIYFDKEYYKPLQIPQSPKGLSDEKKSDSIMMESIKKEVLRMAN
ncbi:hypothetical protein [Labilibaculum sp.]|uniref:hypothetical protein n=1 Tax=Labilibaculum sp. TaxID=2060723 RepID=UPI002AA6F4DA|nr:hypothetical protein [Labilibaculum sp.]MBN2598643.1 hypothetical protein [Marinifilaceae bacterium]